jgi:hypothetical protein
MKVTSITKVAWKSSRKMKIHLAFLELFVVLRQMDNSDISRHFAGMPTCLNLLKFFLTCLPELLNYFVTSVVQHRAFCMQREIWHWKPYNKLKAVLYEFIYQPVLWSLLCACLLKSIKDCTVYVKFPAIEA